MRYWTVTIQAVNDGPKVELKVSAETEQEVIEKVEFITKAGRYFIHKIKEIQDA